MSNLVSALEPITWAVECKYNIVLTNSHAGINEHPGINKLFSLKGRLGSSKPATSMELHIFGLNTLTVLVRDCLECLELPGVRFPSLKAFEDTWKDSFLNECQCCNADDYSRAGLTWAWTLFSLVWPVVGHEQWMWVLLGLNMPKSKIGQIAVIVVQLSSM